MLCLLFFTSLFYAHTIPVDPHEGVLCVVIMVKDEVDVIVPTLEPLINAGVDAVLVYDTGSTDGTQERVQHYFQEKQLTHAYVIEDPFIDFATSRNRSLDAAEELFPNIPFFLMLDAEWYTYNAQEIVSFCEKYKNYRDPGTNGACYSIRLVTIQDSMDNYATRLLRRGMNVRYAGCVHESIQQPVSGILPKSVYFEYIPKDNGRLKSKNRLLRDYDLLSNSLKDNPHNERTLFYLGQTCQFLDRWDEAIVYYKKRAELGAVSEERFLALYRVACAIEYLMVHDENTEYTWNDALYYYLKAHAMLPHRAEPLIRVANYYTYMKEYAVAYLFAKRAVELPFPHTDVLFVEKKSYDFTRHDILGQCAFYVGDYQAGKNAVLNALQYDPCVEYLHQNLSVYERYA